jgi:hypothetical protein
MSAAAIPFLEASVPPYRRNSDCGPEACPLAEMIHVRREHLTARVEYRAHRTLPGRFGRQENHLGKVSLSSATKAKSRSAVRISQYPPLWGVVAKLACKSGGSDEPDFGKQGYSQYVGSTTDSEYSASARVGAAEQQKEFSPSTTSKGGCSRAESRCAPGAKTIRSCPAEDQHHTSGEDKHYAGR